MTAKQAALNAFEKSAAAVDALLLLGLALLAAGARGAVKGLEAIAQSSKWTIPGRAE